MSDVKGTGSHRDDFQLREIWSLLLRSRWLVLGTCAVVVALAAFHTFRQPNVYESVATLRIDPKDAGQGILASVNPINIARGKIETEMFVIRSRAIAEDVVDSLHLQLDVVSPKGSRDELIRTVLIPENAALGGTFDLQRQPNGTYAVEPLAALPDGVTHDSIAIPGIPFRVGSALLELNRGLATAGPKEIRISLRHRQSAAAQLRSALRVSQPDPNAQVVVVNYRSTDPELAAAVPNSVAEAFIRHKSAASKTEARSTIDFLVDQVESYEQELAAAEDQLRSFRESEHVVNLPEEASAQVRRLAELQADHDRLRSEREALSGLLSRVSRNSGEASAGSYRQLASFPVFLSNRAVQDILQSLTALENRRTELLVLRTPTDPDVQGLDARIGELEMQLYQMARNYLDGLESQISSLETTLARFGDELVQIPAREVAFARLQRQQTLLDELYTLLQTRLKEAEIREAVEPGEVRIIDAALVPEHPVSPRPVRNLMLSGLLGMALGLGLAFARQAFDTKVRTREDAEAATAGASVLGMIPRIRATKAVPVGAAANGNGNGNGRRRIGIRGLAPADLMSDRLITRNDPRGVVSEAYRALRTSITFSSSDRTPQVVVMTSAMPGEGKSTSAANLAITLSQQGTRTLLVDADLRRGLLHKAFDVAQEPGLTQVLLGRTPLDDALVAVGGSGDEATLYLLPTGTLPPNPAELLGSPRMRDLLQLLRERFEMVIFDAPPLNLVTDAAVLGTLADSTLLVARTGATDKRALQHAARQVHDVGARIGGVVLNDIDLKSAGYGYGYGYSYGAYAAETSGNGR